VIKTLRGVAENLKKTVNRSNANVKTDGFAHGKVQLAESWTKSNEA